MSRTTWSKATPSKPFWLSLLLLLLPWQGFAGTLEETYETLLTMRVDGEITIDTDGRVQSHRIDTALEPAVRTLLDRAVPKWTFHPVVLDGESARAKSKMRLTLAGRQREDGYQVSIDNALFHDGTDAKDGGRDQSGEAGVEMKLAKRTTAIHPLKYTVNGMTLVTVLLSPTGKVENILATQTSFLNAKGTAAQFGRARRQMEDNAVRAIRNWRFEVKMPAGLAPRPEQLTGSIMVEYVMTPHKNKELHRAGTWRHETRTVQQRVPWIMDTNFAQQVRASDMDDDADMFPSASPMRLHDGVIGKAL